jgi:cell division protein FtsN
VCGLYNLKNQIVIEDCADIRSALLHHVKEPGFGLVFYRPTGFTFEICPAELRAQRAQELIAEYQPVLNVWATFTFGTIFKLWQNKGGNAFDSRAIAVPDNTHQGRPVAPIEDAPKVQPRRFYFERVQLGALGLGFVISAVIIGLLGVLAGKNLGARNHLKKNPTQVAIVVTPQLDELASDQDARAGEGLSLNDGSARGLGEQPGEKERPKIDRPAQKTVKSVNTEPKPVVQEVVEATPPRAKENVAARTVSNSADRKERQASRVAPPQAPDKMWSVQVRSAPDQIAASVLAAGLKTKGYDAFIVETDIKGRTWYRVRVGQFDNQDEAEALRKTLESKEGFRDAFLANK